MRLERWLLALVISVGTWGFMRMSTREREMVSDIDRMSAALARVQVEEALIGTRFTETALGRLPRTSAPGPATLVWVVAAEECHGCLARGPVAHWNALAASGRIATMVVLVGPTEREAAFVHRVISDSTIIIERKQDLERGGFGRLLPNAQVLLDGEGFVLAADVTGATSECDWSFGAQVRAQLGQIPAAAIRQPAGAEAIAAVPQTKEVNP